MKIKNHTVFTIFWSLNTNSNVRQWKLLLSFFATLMIFSSVQVLVFGDESTYSVAKNPITVKSTTIQKIMPPREQIELGVPPLAVVCNDGFQLIFKASDGSPACVHPDSIADLVARGWAQSTAWQNHD